MFMHHVILKIYEKNVSIYIAPSQFMKDMVKSFGFSDEKIVVLKNFVDGHSNQDEVDRENEDTSNTEEYLLSYGRLSKEKGIDVLVEALGIMEKKVRLMIVGSGPEENNLKKQVGELKLEKYVEFVSWKKKDELEEIITSAKAVVIPSVWLENMPFTLLESMSLGKVVVASRLGGMSEMIENGKNGLLFEGNNAVDLAEKLSSLGNYDLMAMGQQARKSVADLNLENHYHALLGIYERVREGERMNK
jgi:glycosyltransferase involved in cell wall biosynthesis